MEVNLMRFVVLILLLLAAHFAATPFAPAPKAWFAWPFSTDSKPVLAVVGGLPQQSGSVFVPLVAGIATLSFLIAILALFGLMVPSAWFAPAAILGAVASILLYITFAGLWAILPIAVDLIVLWGVLSQQWTAAGLRAG
jgi:hypothetical protein